MIANPVAGLRQQKQVIQSIGQRMWDLQASTHINTPTAKLRFAFMVNHLVGEVATLQGRLKLGG
ncbi:hypothetical protein KIF53_22495 [Chromobacterium subtsugae]|uniref:Uncharacterized protein n=2 Tax=Chromobacteriaceae TaxID=1499392 RepID=A0ABS7FK26_9NEIS|nr:hypothetical protein [Chromobacterium subtsugae]